MESLLRSQIQNSCRLALPEGLKDLMCDISREVLRAQPPDLYNFITDHLSALLLARETLSIACRVCSEVCECPCKPELEEELVDIGLEGKDLETAKSLVMKYFNDGEAIKEGHLLMKLFQKTDIDEKMLPSVQKAIRKAFLKHQRNHPSRIKVTPDPVTDRGESAAQRTIKFHEECKDEFGVRNKAATIIQTCFRGYLVRRWCQNVLQSQRNKSVQLIESEEQMKREHMKSILNRSGTKGGSRLSSTSLAGSFIDLPKYIPYSIQDLTHVEFVEREIDFGRSFDYTDETLPRDQKRGHRSLDDIESYSDEEVKAKYEIEEEIAGESAATSVDETIMEEEPFVKEIDSDMIVAIDEEERNRFVTDAEVVTEEILLQNEVISDDETVEEEYGSEDDDQESTNLKKEHTQPPLIKPSQEFTNLNVLYEATSCDKSPKIPSIDEIKEKEVLSGGLITSIIDELVETDLLPNDVMMTLSKLNILEKEAIEDEAFIEFIEEAISDEAVDDYDNN